MVDAWKILLHIALERVSVSLCKLLKSVDRRMRSLALARGIRVMDEDRVEDRLKDVVDRVITILFLPPWRGRRALHTLRHFIIRNPLKVGGSQREGDLGRYQESSPKLPRYFAEHLYSRISRPRIPAL